MTNQTDQNAIKRYYDQGTYFSKGAEVFGNLDSPFQRYRIRKVLEIYQPRPKDRVVDLGCGWGTFCFSLASRCREVVGVDYSQASIDFCNKLLGGRTSTNIRFICADAQNTGLDGDCYQVVICADLFEHLYPEPSERVIEECHRILAPGGRLVIWTPHRGHFIEVLKNNNIILRRDVSHVGYKSMAGLKSILEKAKFAIEKAYYAESHLPGLRAIERALLGASPLFRRRIAILARKAGADD